jgi:hypothetical protein
MIRCASRLPSTRPRLWGDPLVMQHPARADASQANQAGPGNSPESESTSCPDAIKATSPHRWPEVATREAKFAGAASLCRSGRIFTSSSPSRALVLRGLQLLERHRREPSARLRRRALSERRSGLGRGRRVGRTRRLLDERGLDGARGQCPRCAGRGTSCWGS